MKVLKVVGSILAFVVLVGGTNAAQWYFNDKQQKQMREEYEAQIGELTAQIESLGPIVNTFTVKKDVEIYPGMEITQEVLDTVSVPSSFIPEHSITDPAEVVGKYFKIGIKHGTQLTKDLTMETEIDDTFRERDIVAVDYPVGLREGDYVDLTYTLPKGEEYVVLSHIRINKINGNTFKVVLSATNRHIYDGMLVDYFLNSKKGAVIALSKYVEPGVQKPAATYYSVPANIVAIIANDPNIINKVDASVQQMLRGIQDAANLAITTDEVQDIVSGRSEVSSKISGSYMEWKSKRDEELRKQEEARRERELYGEPTLDEEPSGNGDTMKVGEGVIE